MSIRVPATSANLGPGFDVLGLALSLYAEIGVVDTDPMPSDASIADEGHPAHIAFARAGGVGRIWVRNSIPMGRGLGFSGAVRVGGIIAAEVQQVGSSWSRESSRALEIGTELEGHADNVAPSLHGGVVITSENMVVQMNRAAKSGQQLHSMMRSSTLPIAPCLSQLLPPAMWDFLKKQHVTASIKTFGSPRHLLVKRRSLPG